MRAAGNDLQNCRTYERLGTPGALHAPARLAAEAADTLANRWQLRQAELAWLRADVQRIDAALRQLVAAV